MTNCGLFAQRALQHASGEANNTNKNNKQHKQITNRLCLQLQVVAAVYSSHTSHALTEPVLYFFFVTNEH